VTALSRTAECSTASSRCARSGTMRKSLARDEADPAAQHHERGLAGVLVLGELVPGADGDDGLPQRALVPAHHGAGAASGGGPLGRGELLAGECVKGELLHHDALFRPAGDPTRSQPRRVRRLADPPVRDR
jgi:hypothetical protein